MNELSVGQTGISHGISISVNGPCMTYLSMHHCLRPWHKRVVPAAEDDVAGVAGGLVHHLPRDVTDALGQVGKTGIGFTKLLDKFIDSVILNLML
jgi:hypothetical protein